MRPMKMKKNKSPKIKKEPASGKDSPKIKKEPTSDKENEEHIKIKKENEEEEGEKAQKQSERDEDLQQRDEFVKRLQERDKKRTKQKGGIKDEETEKDRETAKLTDEEKKAFTPQLRIKSRQEYLSKREGQQLELMRRTIADEEFLFGDQVEKLTAAERRKHMTNKKLLELAEQRVAKVQDIKRYSMPEAYTKEDGKIDSVKKFQLLTKRYEEEVKQPTEQEQWEGEQTRAATLKFGAKDRQTNEKKNMNMYLKIKSILFKKKLLREKNLKKKYKKKKNKQEKKLLLI